MFTNCSCVCVCGFNQPSETNIWFKGMDGVKEILDLKHLYNNQLPTSVTTTSIT